MTEEQTQLHIASQVKDLLDDDSFCHGERDDKLGGQRRLFSHPAFIQFVITMVYEKGGIATKENVNFIQENFPVPILCFLAALVSFFITHLPPWC